jgi:hypothetical protein
VLEVNPKELHRWRRELQGHAEAFSGLSKTETEKTGSRNCR